VDYILVTKGLLKWIKHGDIQTSVKGSDHCPIYIDLHDEIVLESGEKLALRDAMKQSDEQQEAPRIAAKKWKEFSGKQTLLSTFFGKKVEVKPAAESSNESSAADLPKTRSPSTSTSTSLTDAPLKSSKLTRTSSSNAQPSSSTKKRKPPQNNLPSTSKKKKKDLGPSFAKTVMKSSSSTIEVIDVDNIPEPSSSQPSSSQSHGSDAINGVDLDQISADYLLACELASSQETVAAPSSTPPTPSSSAQSKAAWSRLFAPVEPPVCTVHGEPTKRWTVNKSGPNKGRAFYLCARYVCSWFLIFKARSTEVGMSQTSRSGV
jgi:AP endonuclease 2